MTAPRDRSRSTRNRRLRLHPMCAHCAARGIVKATDQIDHIVPLGFGGLDVDENTQGLCFVCHAIKTASEGAANGSASNFPEWLKPALGPLVIVCGAPFSGKAELARKRLGKTGQLIELDDIMKRLDPRHRPWHGPIDPALINRAIRVRNAVLAGLSRPPKRRAVFVVSAPTKAEREWWQSLLGGEVVLCDPGEAVCIARARKAGAEKAVRVITAWYLNRYQRWNGLPARRRLPRVAFGADGYPLAGQG